MNLIYPLAGMLLYQQVQQSIKAKIIAGIFREGDLLPSEHEFMQEHAVTRSTIRHALSELAREGYITKKQGLGSVVCNPSRRTLGLLSIKGFSQAVGNQQQQVKTLMLDKPAPNLWDEPFFYPLSAAEKKAGCIYLRRIRCVGEEPVMLESTYLPNINLPGLCKRPFLKGSLFETLTRRYQLEITSVEQDLRAACADDELAALLKTRKNIPLLHIFLKFHTNRENMFVYSSLLCNTSHYSIGNKL